MRPTKEMFKTIFEVSTNAIAICDPEGIVLTANAAYFQLCGYNSAQVIGKNFAIIFPENERVVVNERYKTNLSSPAIAGGFESVIERADGLVRTVEVRFDFITEGKTRVAMVSTIRDTTERKRSEEAQSSLAAIVELTNDAIIGKALDGTINSWNVAAERLYGYSADEVLGRNVSILMPPDRPDELRSILEQVAAGEKVETYDTVRICKDGSRVDISLSVSPIFDASAPDYGCIFYRS